MPGVGVYTRTALHGKAANHPAVARRRSTSHALAWFNHGNPAGDARRRAQAAVPSAVISPLNGTMRRFARTPTGATRLKAVARMGRVMIVAARVMATDSPGQRRTQGRVARAVSQRGRITRIPRVAR